jgi:transcriptional regulator with XRE-family HTH domain
LKKRRLDPGLRQKDVAAELGVNFKTYENWEQNKYEPEGRFFPAIVRFLHYDPSPPPSPCQTVSGQRGAGRASRSELLLPRSRPWRVKPETGGKLNGGTIVSPDRGLV